MTTSNGTGNGGAVSAVAGRPLLLAGLGAAAISSSAVLITLSAASAVGTAFYRSALALPVLGVLAAAERRRYGKRSLAQRLQAGLAGLFLAVDLILWTHAIFAVGAGVATVLGNLQVLLVAGIAWLIWRERPGRPVLVALPVVMLGVVLVSGLVGGHATGVHPLAGIGYGIGTSVAYAGFLMTLRGSSGGSPHVAGPVADATAGTTIAAGVYGLAFGGLGLHPLWPAIGWLAMLALISQTLGWLMITSSLPRLPAVVSSLMLLLQPAASLVLAALILGQHPTLLQLAGAALTCCGALAASLAATRQPATRSPDAYPATAAPLRFARTARSALPRHRSWRRASPRSAVRQRSSTTAS
jgi:drug/metabolite transporter (DMT)-like permease